MKPDKHPRPFGNGNEPWRQRARGPASRNGGRGRQLRLEPLEQRQLLSVNVGSVFDGILDTGLRPPGPITAAGPDNLVALVNSNIALFDKDGAQQESTSLSTFFDTVAEDLSNPFDPWAVYDRYSDRFFVSAEEVESGEGADEANLLIGISRSDYPDTLSSADWRWLTVDGTYDFGNIEFMQPGYIDYAKIATDADSIYVSGNYLSFDNGDYLGVVITRLDKADALAGMVTVTAQVNVAEFVDIYLGDPSDILQPAQSVGRAAGEPQLFVGADPENEGIDVYEFDDANNLTLVANNLFDPWSEFSGGAPQAEADDTLDTLSDRLMNAVWRNDSLWTTHTIDVNGVATVRWYEIGTEWGYFEIQTGDVSPAAGVHTFMPAINVNASGQMALTFTQSSEDQFAAMMITGRQPGQPYGFTETPVVAQSGLAGYQDLEDDDDDDIARWGDYAGLALDPQDDHTFWALGETAATTDAWRTTFAEFEVGPLPQDEFESPTNNSLSTATVLGSLPKITLRDLTIDDGDDVDYFQITAQDTGKLVFNVFFQDALGDIDIQIVDAGGDVIASAISTSDDELLVIPVVGQQRYYLRVYGFAGDTSVYDLEIENFAAPVPDAVVLDPTDDTGASDSDNVTNDAVARIFIEADLADFFDEGINILTPDEVAAGASGAAVQVFVNGVAVGYATPTNEAAPPFDSDYTLFTFEFASGDLLTGLIPLGIPSGVAGELNFVKAAVRIFDGQLVPQNGRSRLSESLLLTLDTAAPVAPAPDLLSTSDSGASDTDNVTNVTQPAFSGTAEANTLIRVYANDVLVGEGVVGSDNTDLVPGDGRGAWEVTVEPLDAGTYSITTRVEDLAGNLSEPSEARQIWIDTIAPNTPYLDLVDASDSGRSNYDNVTNDNQPTVTVTANDTPTGDGNPFPNEIIYRIYDRPDPIQFGGTANNGEVLLVDSFVTNPNFTADGFFTEVLNTLADGVTPYTLLDGVHNLKLEVEDLAGNISQDFLLTVTIDTVAPPVSIVGIDPAATDTGIEDQPELFVDRITSDTATGVVGWAEANAIVRLYVDPTGDGAIDNPAEYSLTVALPEDGNLAFPDGQWWTAFLRDLNDPNFFPLDGLREILVTAEDVAGNVNTVDDEMGDEGQVLDIFIDTRGPQVDEVSIAGHEDYDLFDPKPSEDGPTPLVYSLDIDFVDRPVRGEAGAGGVQAVDVFLLFDDTGSFSGTAPLLIAQFPALIASLQASLPGTSLAFGVGRFEEYGSFASEDSDGRPFILNQPILEVSDPQFDAAINAALNRTAPGYGGDGPETAIEALYQVATGAGFDGNGNATTTESGASGLVTTQTTPGDSGDVPAFASFTADAGGPVVDPSGTLGGVGFRADAVRLVLLATDIGFAYQPDGLDPYVGVGGVEVAAADVQYDGRGSTPDGRGAEIQATIDALNALGIQVIGLGNGTDASQDPRLPLESVSILTGAINNTIAPIDSGIAGDLIQPGEPLFFYIDPNSGENVADAIAAAVTGAVGTGFLYPAVNEILATTPGNIQLVGDANGIIPIASIDFLDHTVSGDVGRTTVRLNFYEPLPDDRFTLTVSDHIMDDAGNALDGESNAAEPQETPLFPSGDGEPGGEFVARFTIDSRPEIGVWAAGSVWVDTNGNFTSDPDNLDFTNRDITYVLAFTSDNVFNGNFACGAADTADGFDKLAAYGRVGGQYRWLIDTDNDGVPNLDVNDPANVNGLPVAGRFDNSTTNGDEVGLFTGTTWYFDTNHDYRVDMSLVSDLRGYAIVGDFDGDGFDDLATYVDDHFEFDLANGVLRGWDGHVDATIDFGFIGVRERPVAADINQDGIDDIGLWVPDRAGATPEETSEWYFLISDAENEDGGPVGALDHPFTPIPFGDDVYARFGDEYAMPLVGNFDPPVTIDETIVPLGTARLSATLVKTPTAVGALGEIDALPESDPSIDEWDTYWVEIWVDAADTNGVGVALAMADVSYNTDCFTPAAIEYGPAFTENQMGTIDDAAGVIHGLGAGTSAADLGDGRYVLLARVQFAPTTDDPGLPVSADARVESRSCDVALGETRIALADDLSAAVRLADPPATALRPFSYDLDDDGTVGLGDLSYFAAAYKHTVGAPGVGYTHASDFDDDGVIGLGDLSYFAAAYGRVREDLVLAASGSGSQAAASAPSMPAGLSAASSERSAAAVDAAMTEQAPDAQTDTKSLVAAWAQTPARRTRLTQPSDKLAKTLAVDWFFSQNE